MKKNLTKNAQKNLKDVKVWFRDDYKKRDGTCTISLIVYLCGKRKIFNTGVSVNPKYWDYKKQAVKTSHAQSKDYNLIIGNCRTRINDIFVRYRLQHKELTPELLVKEYETKTSYVDFYIWLKYAVNERRDEIAPSSYSQHMVLLSKLKEYRKSLTFSEIDERFIMKFRAWLKNTKKNDVGTVHNTLKTFKTYINIAIKEGVIETNPFEYIKLVKPKPDRDFLTEDELERLIALYEKNYLNPTDQKILRHYLFSCFTSLRISDLRAFSMEMIINNMIVYVPIKTHNVKPKAVRIPLSKPALKLINDESPNRLKGNVFELFADSRMNKRLKEIAPVAKIHKEITFHSSRHTFATIFLRRTKNIVALKELLGHSSVNQTMVYAHLLSDDLVSEMKTFDDFIF